jgi:phospholipid/cholesterol/gamma-HCH transport system substrate-binding protein
MSKEFRLGLFIVATLLILASGVFLIGDKQSLFHATYRIRAEFQNVAGLSPGAAVRVGGIQEGTVRRIGLPTQPGDKVVVEMDLQKATRDIVKKDSLAEIKAEGLLGDKYVEVSFGSKEAEKLEDGETIASEPPLDYSDLIQKADQILDTTRDAVQNVQDTAGNLKSVTSKIDHGEGTMGALVNDKTIYQQASAGVTALREDMEALKHNFLLRGFFKKRGYEDSDELTKHGIPKLPPGPYLKTFAFDASRMFGRPDSAKLKNEKVLNNAGHFLEGEKFGLAVVAASTGMKGDSDKDRQLTEARTMVIRDYLVQHFSLDDTRIKTIGLGKTEQAGAGDEVEILIYPLGPNLKLGQRAAR